MEKTIKILDIREDVKEFLAMPDGIKKNIAYSRNFQGNHTSSANILIKEDGNIHYSHTTYKISKGIKYFLKPTSKHGFTVEPKGRMRVWYNGKLHSLPMIDQVLRSLGREWLHYNYLQFMTPSLMGKVIAGKITNPHDLAKAILKMNRIEGSPAILNNAILNDKISKSRMLLGGKVAKNFDHYVEYISDVSTHTVDDLCNQAIMLEKRIDFKWSTNRMEQEHRLWTKEIMDYESDSLSTDKLEWLDEFYPFTPDGFKLLDNEKDVYYEGKLMSHCVFTNYWHAIKNKEYVVYSITTFDNQNYTLGCGYDKVNGLMFNQLYGKHNSQAPDYLHRNVKDWIKDTNSKLNKIPQDVFEF